MSVRVGINGFGRIGRNVLRAARASSADVSVVAINDLIPPETNAHLLAYDSTLGRLEGVQAADGAIRIGSDEVKVFAERDPKALPWSELGVEVVIESTGIFTDGNKAAAHIDGGARRVIISAPATNVDATFVMGVNDQTFDPAKHTVVSNASCTTNCFVPMVKVLDDAFGVRSGLMTTVHAYTNDQPTHDQFHKDLYRARAAAISMIPTSTGAAKAVGLVLPELAGRLDGVAIRVPTPNVSVVDLKIVAKRATTPDEINGAVKRAAAQELKGILGFTDRPNVSIDFNHDARSSIVHLDQTKVMDGTLVRVMSWYDNEWGFSNRMLDTAVAMGKLI
jgi:glyceraldehyde 3-phosphate dehydrogenase